MRRLHPSRKLPITVRTRTGIAGAVFAACLTAGAADRVWHPYRDVCENLGLIKLHEVPEAQRDHVRILYKLPADDPVSRTLVFTIDSRKHPLTVTPDASGAIEFPYDEQLLAENPDVLVNLPAGKKVSFEADIRPRAPASLEISYTDLMKGVAQANALIRKQAGMLSLFVPTMRSMVLQFDHADGQAVTIGSGASQRQIRVDDKAQIVIPYDAVMAEANPRVRLSAMPRSADFAQ